MLGNTHTMCVKRAASPKNPQARVNLSFTYVSTSSLKSPIIRIGVRILKQLYLQFFFGNVRVLLDMFDYQLVSPVEIESCH